MAAITAITADRYLSSTAPERAPRAGLSTTGPARDAGGERAPRWARLEPATGPTTPVRRRREARERIFRRRRLVVAVAVALLAFVAGVVLALALMSVPAGGSLTDEAREAQQVRHVVDAGDTLWSVAARIAPDDDPRVVVDALAGARGTSTIVPGDVIVWPLD